MGQARRTRPRGSARASSTTGAGNGGLSGGLGEAELDMAELAAARKPIILAGRGALDELPAGVAVLEEQRPQLVEMLRRIDALGQVGSDILLTSREDLIADLRALRPVLQYLGESTPDLIELTGFVPTFPFPDSSIRSTIAPMSPAGTRWMPAVC